ncbi:MAG: aminoglycoside phosphotransferase family protein [Candidatus Woesearchaeota archaeon]|nr:MAG: aminoglycoside phosphotransferase family protein [Candidatus Woesearchaeota archaeon]
MLSNKSVLKIIKKIDPEVRSVNIREFTEAGNINLMYKISTNIHDRAYVLRGAPNKFDASKYDKEVFLHSLINKKLKIPVPKILFFDKTKKILPFAYLVMEFKKGDLANNEVKKMNSGERLKLFRELGKNLAKLHSIKFSKYGQIFGDKVSKYEEKYSKPFDTWKEFYIYSFNNSVQKLSEAKNIKYGKISKKHFLDLLPKLEEHLSKNMIRLKSSKKPSLIHDDYRLFNILVKKNKITAILDFEMAKAGAPENELCILPFIWDKNNPLKLTKEGKAFIKGYAKISEKEVINYRKVYVPLSLFMEISYDFYHELKYKEAPQVMSDYYNSIRYVLGLINLKDFKSQAL